MEKPQRNGNSKKKELLNFFWGALWRCANMQKNICEEISVNLDKKLRLLLNFKVSMEKCIANMPNFCSW